MTIPRSYVEKILNDWRLHLPYHRAEGQQIFLLANCYVQLGEFEKANGIYRDACQAMINDELQFWKEAASPHWFVDVWMMSGQKELFPAVIHNLEGYIHTPLAGDGSCGELAFSFYARGLMELLYPTNQYDLQRAIRMLKKRPKWKDIFAMGKALEALSARDNDSLNRAIDELLSVHGRVVKYGSLRNHPEGLLCLPAMTMVYVARNWEMQMEIQNDYLSLGYLDFLDRSKSDGSKLS